MKELYYRPLKASQAFVVPSSRQSHNVTHSAGSKETTVTETESRGTNHGGRDIIDFNRRNLGSRQNRLTSAAEETQKVPLSNVDAPRVVYSAAAQRNMAHRVHSAGCAKRPETYAAENGAEKKQNTPLEDEGKMEERIPERLQRKPIPEPFSHDDELAEMFPQLFSPGEGFAPSPEELNKARTKLWGRKRKGEKKAEEGEEKGHRASLVVC